MLDPKPSDTSLPHPTASEPRPFSATALTYAQLLDEGCRYLKEEGLSVQQVRNLASALRQWVAALGYAMSKVVSEELGRDFDRHFDRFCGVLEERLAPRTQRDRQEQILRWRRIASALRVQDTLPAAFSQALEHCLRTSPLTRRQIAQDSGTTTNTLRLWCSNANQPRGDAIKVIARLEEALELARGTLASRLPLARRTRYARHSEKQSTATSFTRTRRSQAASSGQYRQSFTPRLEQQWKDVLRLKTDPMRDDARARNTWRIKPIRNVSQAVTPAMLIDGQICLTAGIPWGNWSSYLGWLKLPAPDGGAMAADSVDTLAWLADPARITQYARWLMHRSGNRFHNGVNVFLQLVESYLRPKTGYIWLHTQLRITAPELVLLGAQDANDRSRDSTGWRQHCELARAKVRAFRVRAEDTMGIRLSRDPAERSAVVLHDDFPLMRLIEFIQKLERSVPPPGHARDYRVWLRDVTLCRMLVSNPLRVGQYASMTFKTDGTGNLVRMGPGRYRLHFGPSDFKNEKGAACTVYDAEVDASVGPWLDRYLAEARPDLVFAAETHRLFLPAVLGPRKEKKFLEREGLEQDRGWSSDGMADRIKSLTLTYIDGCPGFGPHAFRHVISTDHLRRHPGDYLTVATLLHDKLETVLKNYSHLRVADGLRVLSRGIKEASEQLAAMRMAR